MREQIQLARCVISDYIYIIKFERFYLVSKDDVSMLEIEKYNYVGKILGLDLYIEPILLKGGIK